VLGVQALERVQEPVLEVQQRAQRQVQEPVPQVQALERVQEPVLEVQQQAQGQVLEPAPEVQARGQPAAPARAARPRGVRAPELDQQVRVLAPRAVRAPEGQAQEAQGLRARAEQVALQEVLVP
jgi:hypothetical protein